MAKKVDALIKLQVPAGGANPSPPVGWSCAGSTRRKYHGIL